MIKNSVTITYIIKWCEHINKFYLSKKYFFYLIWYIIKFK